MQRPEKDKKKRAAERTAIRTLLRRRNALFDAICTHFVGQKSEPYM